MKIYHASRIKLYNVFDSFQNDTHFPFFFGGATAFFAVNVSLYPPTSVFVSGFNYLAIYKSQTFSNASVTPNPVFALASKKSILYLLATSSPISFVITFFSSGISTLFATSIFITDVSHYVFTVVAQFAILSKLLLLVTSYIKIAP